jgi:hypothetical protein
MHHKPCVGDALRLFAGGFQSAIGVFEMRGTQVGRVGTGSTSGIDRNSAACQLFISSLPDTNRGSSGPISPGTNEWVRWTTWMKYPQKQITKKRTFIVFSAHPDECFVHLMPDNVKMNGED